VLKPVPLSSRRETPRRVVLRCLMARPRTLTIHFCLRLNGSPDPCNNGLTIRKPSDCLYSRQVVPDRNQSLLWPFVRQLALFLFASEGTAGIHISRALLVDNADVILGCEMK
jgi:hypothetical protein